MKKLLVIEVPKRINRLSYVKSIHLFIASSISLKGANMLSDVALNTLLFQMMQKNLELNILFFFPNSIPVKKYLLHWTIYIKIIPNLIFR